MSQASQRVSKLSRRARPAPAPAPDPAHQPLDLDTSDDFTASLSFPRSALSQSSCAAEPCGSQSQQLSGDINPLRATSVSFCGVLDGFLQQPASRTCQQTAGDQGPSDSVEDQSGDDGRRRRRDTAGLPPSGGRSRRATRAAASSCRPGRSTRQSAAELRVAPPATPPAVDLSRFARPAETGSKPASLPPSGSAVRDLAKDSPADVPAVTDCPVCLQPLPSAAARAAHLKLCGERRGLSPAQLLAAVRLQRKQVVERAAAGLPPTRAAVRRRRPVQQDRRRPAAAVASSGGVAGDADLQMALAVSASLRDEQERTRRVTEAQLLELGLGDQVEAARDGGAPAVPPEPDAPASAPAPATGDPPAGRNRGGRRGRRKAAASVLLSQTREERGRRLSEKVAQLLAWEEEVPVEGRRRRTRAGSGRPAPAWEKAAQLHTDQADYSVPELAGLVEPCTAPITSMLKDVADIPGRANPTQVSGGDPGSGGEAEEADDPAGATQAALLLLAGDSDSQSSQPAACPDTESSQPAACPDTESSQPAACPDTESSQPAAGAPSGPAAARGRLQMVVPTPTVGGPVSGVPEVDMTQCHRTDRAQGKTIENGAGRGKMSLSRSAAAGPVGDDGVGITSAINRPQTSPPGGGTARPGEETLLPSPSQRSDSGGGGARRPVIPGAPDDVCGPAERSCVPSSPAAAAASFGGASGDAEASSVVSTRRRVPLTAGSECGRSPGPGYPATAGPEGAACFSSGTGDLGAALLELLLTGGGPATASLLCRDGPVAVHPAVLAARCPPLYRAVAETGGRLPLPEVGCRAAAALIRLLYLGESRCAAEGGPLPQLLLLADRFGLVRLARHLREEHGVTEPAAEPPAPLSPELFDLAEWDGTQEMEPGSPAGHAAQPPASSHRHTRRRGSSENDIIWTPGQSEERGDGKMEMIYSGLNSSPSQAEGMPKRTEKTSPKGARTPAGHVTPSPVGGPSYTAGDGESATPSTPRRSRKRSTVTPRRAGSSEGGCEVFTSLPKRRRTASPANRTERSGSPAGRTGRSGSPAGRTGRSRSPASPELQSALPGSQKPACESQERRPSSADSDVEILDEMPAVFTQRVKSPRRSACQGEDATSPVAASNGTSGRGGEYAQSEASPAKMTSTAAGGPAKSPAEDVFLPSSLSLSQSRRQQRSGCGDDPVASSPLISKRRERDGEVRDQPPSDRRESDADEAISHVRSQRPSTQSGPVSDGDVSAASLPPCSPELPIVSPLQPIEATSPASWWPESGPGSAPRPPSPGDRPVSPAGGPSTPSPLPMDDVWDGFEDGGFIELMEPPPLDSPLRADPGRSSTPAAPPPGPRSSLDRSELWQDSSLLAHFTTPTAAERTTDSRRVDTGPSSVRSSGTGSPRVRQKDPGSPRVRQKDPGSPRVRQEDPGSPRVRQKDPGSPRGRQKDHGSPAVRQKDHGSPAVCWQDAGTPEAGMPPPQRTPVNNPYRVVLRDSNTPMPNYVLMLTPELKRQLARIGVKPIARRKAVALLSHIYEETHPPVSAAGGSDRSDLRRPTPSTRAASSPAAVSCSGRTRPPDAPGGCTSARSVGPDGSWPSPGQSGSSDDRPDDGDRFARPPEPAPAPAPSREPPHRSDSDSESEAESSGSEGAAARLEEVFGRLGERLEREEEDEEVTPSQAACAASLPEVLRSFIQSRPELYHQVLTYEPVWLERLYRDLRQAGVKLNVSQLMDFLDQQCITFRTENSGRKRKSPKKKRSPTKTSPKKRGPSQKKKSPQKKVN